MIVLNDILFYFLPICTYFDYVGLTDSNDFYRLPLQNNSRFNLSFTPQNNYLNIVLGQDKNQNGIIESTEVLDDFGRSANSPGAEEYSNPI